MANQSSNNSSSDNNNGNASSSSSSQTDIRVNSVNRNPITTSELSQGFNSKNLYPNGSNSDPNQKNPALGQKIPNENSDKPSTDIDDKKNNNRDDKQSHNNSSTKKPNSDSDSDSNLLKNNNDNNINNNNAYDPSNPNNRLDNEDSNEEQDKFHKNNTQNTNKESEKQEEDNDDTDNNGGAKTGPNLLNNSIFLDAKKRKIIIISSSIIIGIIIAFLIFIPILNTLIVMISSSMCDNGTQSSYSGSGDVLEFMCAMQSPLGDKSYTISSPAGEKRSYEDHPGIDLAIGGGTPIYAVQSGKVIRAGWFGGYGNCVDIDHGNGIVTRYGHMLSGSIQVSEGEIINKGARIGSVGSTGQSDGDHLHFEIRVDNNPVYDQNAYFDYRGTGGYEYRSVSEDFLKSCGSSAIVRTSTTSTDSDSTTIQKPYDSIEILKTIHKSTGDRKSISMSGKNPQSFAYYNDHYYVQWISPGANGKDGYIHKYDSNISFKDSSKTKQAVGHGNGLAYSTADNKLYSVTVSGIRNNKKATIIDPNTLKVTGDKSLDHGTSSIAYDKLTNRFITSSGAANGSASSTGYLYVYNSDLSSQVGAKSIAKKRWKTPGDIAAYGGIIYVCIHESVGKNYIDMYNEDTGDYLGSYSAPFSEIEGIDINDNGEIVLLFHGPDVIQFTGIKANVINSSGESLGFQSSDQCCLNNSSTTYTATSSDYCPNGITVTGDYAGTYELDDYIERVVTAENGGAHPEALKALAIAARTYALNRTDNCKNSIENSTSAQVMAEEASDRVKEALSNVKGSIMLYNGNYFSAQYSSFYGKCNGTQCTSTFIKTPSEEKATFTMPYTYLTTAADAGHEYGLSQNGSHYMATVQGKTYDEILKFFYAEGIEITGTQSSGGSCSLGGNGTYQNGKIWDYNQADYSDPYCEGTIADSGCGPTAMAMVVSTFLKEQHDPPELAKITTDTGLCSTQTHEYFEKAAEKYNLTYQKIDASDAEEVLTALNRGDSLVIANVTNKHQVDGLDNFWTEGGHYIVLAGHEGREVWVQDPNKGMANIHRTNTKGDGVYDFDKYIKPAATNGYMIFKKA